MVEALVSMIYCILNLFFQNPYNVVSLQVIGDDKATTYFDIEQLTNTANVKVKADLTADADTYYTVSSL